MTQEAQFSTPLGWMTARWDEGESLTALSFGEAPRDGHPASSLATALSRQLHAYALGERREFALPLKPAGTAFQLSVWRQLLDIPYGRTLSYRELAVRCGLSVAHARAVGAAVGANPIAILIPCHRIVGSRGSLTGYAYGLTIKKALLDLEMAGNPAL